MALIGTISGSNRTSTTAISGSLIIADEPGNRFPTLAGGVKLFVSGAKTTIGADTPVAVFGGDTFVSGAFGTDSYIQMKPVGTLRVPSNTTASYIYTSGSTNDLYFTQYSGPYTNTTRLRWLESEVATGLLYGGVLSTAPGTTTFSITAGDGLIVTQNASTTAAPYPTFYRASWGNIVSRSLDYISTAQITYIGIDGSSQIVQRTSPISLTEDASIIPIGRILHTAGSVTSAAVMNPSVAYGGGQYLNDFVRAIGPLKVSGHVLAASGSTLGITRTAGQSFVLGKNYTLDPNNPNVVPASSDPATVNCKVWRQYINASGNLVIDSNAGAGYTGIDPSNYVNAGVLTAVPPNKYTIQRVFWFPNSSTNAFNVYYGTATYNSLSAAETAISSEAFTEAANTQDAAIFLGYICVKEGTTDLSNTSDAALLQSGLFRNISGGGGSGGATIPGDGDTSVQFNDGGYFGGTSDFRFVKSPASAFVANLVVTGSAAGSLTSSGSIYVKDASGVVKSTIGVDGNITGSNFLASGDIAVNGGDITSSAASLNISAGASGFAFQQTGTSFATFASGANGPIQQATLQASSGKSIVLAAGLGSTAQTTISGSYVDIRTGRSGSPSGVDFSSDVAGLAQSYLNVVSGSYSTPLTTVTNVAKIAPSDLPVPHDVLLGASATRNLYLSGATVAANAGSNGFVFQRDGVTVGLAQGVSGSSFTIGSGNGITAMNLVSSGNMTIRLDVDNNALGHTFEVQDYSGSIRFKVSEDGLVEVGANLYVTGASNLVGNTTLATVGERILTSNGGTGVVSFDLTSQSIFYVNGPTGGITANFTNTPTTNNRVITPTVIVSQSATPQGVSGVQIDGAAQTINWANGTTPTANAGKQDVYGFSLIRSGSAWKVLGQLSTYG